MLVGLLGRDERGEPVPALAETWRAEQAGAADRFRLRAGVARHDGAPLTSADLQFTFEELPIKYHARTRALVGPSLAGIETPDAGTAQRERHVHLVLPRAGSRGRVPADRRLGPDRPRPFRHRRLPPSGCGCPSRPGDPFAADRPALQPPSAAFLLATDDLGRDLLAWWLAAFPGAAIAATVLALALLSDALGDALRPRD
jgi:hypothetical protein